MAPGRITQGGRRKTGGHALALCRIRLPALDDVHLPSVEEDHPPWTAPASNTASTQTLKSETSTISSIPSAVSSETRQNYRRFMQGYLAPRRAAEKPLPTSSVARYQESLKMLAMDKTPEPEQQAFQGLDELALDELTEHMRKPPTAPASFGSNARANRAGTGGPRHDFKDHYSFFANLAKGALQECTEDQDTRLNAQLARQRKQRIVFAPFKSPLKKIAEEDKSKDEGVGELNLAMPDFDDENEDNEDEEEGGKNPSSPRSPRPAANRRPTVTQRPHATGSAPAIGKRHGKGESRKENFSSAIKGAQYETKQKEACESLRYLIFGCIGNEKDAAQDKHNVYDQRIGKREEVFHFYRVWHQMDEDGSGDIEFHEFLNFFSANKADWLLGMRCVKYLLGSGAGGPEAGLSKTCCAEDMIRLLWLKAAPEDLQIMMRWFKEAAFHQRRAPTPPLLPKRKRRELIENFKWIMANHNKDDKEKITYTDLVDSGLVDSKMADDLMAKYDLDGSNDLDCNEFLELLCPNGYRAHVDAMQAVDKQGNQLCRVKNEYFQGWTIEGAFDNLPEQFRLEAEGIKSDEATDVPSLNMIVQQF